MRSFVREEARAPEAAHHDDRGETEISLKHHLQK
jgi:hypothetical protein